MKRKDREQLRDALAKLYPSRQDAKDIAERSGLDVKQIIGTSSVDRWNSLLLDFEKQGELPNLRKTTVQEFSTVEPFWGDIGRSRWYLFKKRAGKVMNILIIVAVILFLAYCRSTQTQTRASFWIPIQDGAPGAWLDSDSTLLQDLHDDETICIAPNQFVL